MKYKLVLWSGGLDSTFLIQHEMDKNPKTLIKAGYCELLNNDVKSKMEKSAIEKMVPIFQEKYKERFWYLGKLSTIGVDSVYPQTCFNQVPLWITTAVMSGADCSDVLIGYCMNDDAVSYISEIKKVYNSYKNLSLYPKEFAKLSFPLLKWKKTDMYDNLDYRLKELIVWCEHPKSLDGIKFDPCDYCDSCKRRNMIFGKTVCDENSKKHCELPVEKIEGRLEEPVAKEIDHKLYPNAEEFYEKVMTKKNKKVKQKLFLGQL